MTFLAQEIPERPVPDRTMTEREVQVLGFIRDFTVRHRLPPTVRETAQAFGMSVNRAHHFRKRLFAKGYLERYRRLYFPHDGS